MNIKLVATDMDGTFLDDKGQFDMVRLKQLLLRFKEKGIYFAVASGRGLLSLEKLFEDVRDEIIFIAENGSLVEFHGEDLYEATMSKDFYLSAFEKLKTSPFINTSELLLTGKKGCYVLETVAAGEAWVNQHVPGVKAMTTGYKSIDIVLDYVDKGVAIVELAKKLNLEMDQVMTFGDNLNDLHMMQVAGYPIAPENARPEILEVAKEVIGHHAAHSVMTYMEGL